MIDLKIIFSVVLSLGVAIGIIVTMFIDNSHVEENIESTPVKSNPSVREEMFGPTESVAKQLELFRDDSREMFGPTEDVRNQLKLP